MPELPEIEVTRRLLSERLKGLRVEDAWLKPTGKTSMTGEERLPELVGRRLQDVGRRGKMLVLEFTDGPSRASGQSLSLLVHLMLIGRIALFPGGKRIPVDPRLRVRFEGDHELEVRFVAARSLALLPSDEVDRYPAIAKQGPDALLLTRTEFQHALARTRGAVKNLFMDQEHISGVGNAYADEILFEARVDPMTPVGDLAQEPRQRVYEAIGPVLMRAIELGAAQEYVEDLGPVPGITSKDALMRVHNRRGRACPVCGTKVQMKLLKGRNTFFCPECQGRGE